MNCCNDPIDLGCVSSCDDVVTNIAAGCAGNYVVSYTFNGAVITKVLPSSGGGGFLAIPAGTFNEVSGTTFSVSNGGELLGCYKVRMFPGQPTPAVEVAGAVGSDIVLSPDICVDGITEAFYPINGVIILSTLDGVQNGTTITIQANYPQSAGVTSVDFVLDPVSQAYATIDGDTITITDIDLLSQVAGEIRIVIEVIYPLCGGPLGLTAQVGCLGNLVTGYISGVQNVSNEIPN